MWQPWQGLDDWTRPVPPKRFVDYPCPGCGMKTVTYLGGGPKDIECANADCKYYKKPELKTEEGTCERENQGC